jgi:hypothetical protein
MNCNCLETVPKKITDHLSGLNPEWQIKDSGFVNTAYVFTTPTKTVIGLPFEVEYELQSKKGKTLSKKHKVSMFPTFCPFCGVKLED